MIYLVLLYRYEAVVVMGAFDSKEQADEKRDWLASLYPPDAQSPDELWVMETPLNRLFTDDFSYKKTDYGYGDGLTWPGR